MSKTIKTLTALLMISDGPESKKSLCEKFEIDNEELESLINLKNGSISIHISTNWNFNCDFLCNLL